MRRALAAVALLAVSTLAHADGEEKALARLPWRSIGPANMGGRVADIAGIPGDPATYYVVPANGGIYKTTNGGATFVSLFDKQQIASVGAIAIAPSDPNVVWAGTGEGDPRNSTGFGDGVYRSTDAGATWTHLGLTDTERIKRIRVDPKDPDTAYVCALGHAWGANEERGLFKTRDGGKTWSKILYKDKDTGCSDVDIDPGNPRILYAGLYTFRRRPWRFDSGGGETALYKTIDGGATWKKLGEGLPKGPMDRIGIAVARSNPEIVYMVTEAKGEDGGELFRSEDRGETWKMVNNDPNINFRPFYYSDIRVDPNDPSRVFSLSGSLNLSKDGGKTFERIAGNVHGDHQALWIDPLNSNRVLSGSDGGFQVSMDGGRTWDVVNNVAMAQFYHVAYDLRRPYSLCGGLQDNGTWCGPSATTFTEGIRKDDWYTIGGGDGFFAVPDLASPNLVYADSQGGAITLRDTDTGLSRNIHPYPKEVGSSGNAIKDYKYRFNWNPPIVLSPHDPKTVYYGGNVVFKTTSYGQSWDVISPDLTTDDKTKQQSSGGAVVVDNTAAEFHCTILTIAESPVQKGVIWVGTDDGNVQVTKDGGRTWANVVKNIPGLPANSWIPSIEASHFDAGTAYVAVDRHRDDDFRPWAFKTTDFGASFTPIKSNLPEKGYVHVVREDPRLRNLLYAGTELGAFASWDGGKRWVSIRGELPPLAVRDIQVHPREGDVILATHSRGLFVLDDAGALRGLPAALGGELTLFPVRTAVRWQMWGRDNPLGTRTYAADNPPYGALIDYYLKDEPKPKERVQVTVADSAGTLVREIEDASKKAGLNRVAWDLRGLPPRTPAAERGGPGGGGAGGRFGFGRFGPPVLPGEYTVTVKAGGKEAKQTLKVEIDPRVRISEPELLAQNEAVLALRDLTSSVNLVVERCDDLSRQLTALADRLKREKSPAEPALAQALEQVKGLRERLTRPTPSMIYRQQPRIREELQALSFAIGGTIAPPTDSQRLRLDELKAETAQVVAEANAILKAVDAINERLKDRPAIAVGEAIK